jgi:hypothetical protein
MMTLRAGLTLLLGLLQLGFGLGQFLRKSFGPFDIAALFSLLHEPTQSLGKASQIKYAHSQRGRAREPELMFRCHSVKVTRSCAASATKSWVSRRVSERAG